MEKYNVLYHEVKVGKILGRTYMTVPEEYTIDDVSSLLEDVGDLHVLCESVTMESARNRISLNTCAIEGLLRLSLN